ncbi:unnamed protein product [Heligmosomoides polygyrus]|uniref:LETM1 domain-containing protein n=1 Tax=Heligmosomoides polygyrus TaxID=6339 RepID=A0A183FX20_HELPZ|nr:unnamed protein product [Heligmosomoides polygyrus]
MECRKRNTCVLAWTSAGPPPPTPSKPGSFSARYDAFIARWPKVYALHRMVVDGSRWCFADIKTYVRLKREITNPKQLQNLTMSELEVLVQSGGELAKMIALVVVLQIPGPGDILILLLIFFPRLILTRHFWSDAQRKKYFQLDVQRSLANSSLPGLLGNVSVVDQIMKPCWDEGEVLFAHATAGFLTRKGSHLMVSLCHFDRIGVQNYSYIFAERFFKDLKKSVKKCAQQTSTAMAPHEMCLGGVVGRSAGS